MTTDNEAAERLRSWILRYFPDAATDPYGTDTLDAALARERSVGAAPIDVDAYREALREMIEHDAEQSDNCGDWGTNPCLIRERAASLLDATPSPSAAPIDVERLARAAHAASGFSHGSFDDSDCGDRVYAERVAKEYDLLALEGTER